MRFEFSEQEKDAGANKLQIEDIDFCAYYVEGEGSHFRSTGRAIVDNEVYNEFVIEFETETEPAQSAAAIIDSDWLWYDFIFEP